MNTNIKLLVFWMLTLIIVSCSKDSSLISDIEDENFISQEIETREYVEEECGFIDELCLKCEILVAELPHELSPTHGFASNGGSGGSKFQIDDNHVDILIGTELYRVFPTNYFDNSDEFLITSSSGSYIITNSTDPFVNSYDLGNRLPIEIDKVLGISNEELAKGNLTLQDLYIVFGNEATVSHTQNNNFKVELENTGGGNGNARLIDPCKGVNMAALTKKYVEILGMGNVHSQAEQIISEALEECTPQGFNPKTACIDSKCVVDNALLNPLIANSDAAPFQIKLNYITSLLGLSTEEYNQLKLFSQENRDFIDQLYNDLGEEREFLPCENADCSLKLTYQSLIGIHLNSDETLTTDDISDTKIFFEQLYCDKGSSFINGFMDDIGPCGLQYITIYLREDLPTSDIYTLIDKYREAYKVYYTYNNDYHQPLGDQLLAEGVTWCDMIEIINVMYEGQLGLPTLVGPNGSSSSVSGGGSNSSVVVGPVLLLFKALGEGFGDALAQSFFIWVADNGIDDFPTAIENVDPFEVTLAFFKGLIPWTGTTQKIGAQLALDAGIAAIVVMDRAIEQPNYTWEQAGNDFATTFTKYVVGDIFGAAFAKYGSSLVKGVIKKFDFATSGFFGTTLSFSKISKIMGGGLDNNPPYSSFSYTNPEFGFIEINPIKMMKEWNITDEVFIIGRGVDSRIEPYKNFLNSQGFNAKSICDSPLWDCSNFDPTVLTVEVNRDIIRQAKLDGIRILDIGSGDIPGNSSYYNMELDEIFN